MTTDDQIDQLFVKCSQCKNPSMGSYRGQEACLVHAPKLIRQAERDKELAQEVKNAALDPINWGVEKQGARLLINEPNITDSMWVIDIENNLDGSCAGVGLTDNGEIVRFYTADVVAKWHKDTFKNIKLVGHNIKYDVQMLRKWGFNVSADQIVWDTQLAEYVRDSTRFKFGLKPLIQEYFGVSYPDYKSITGKGKASKSIGQCDPLVLANYNGCDVLFTYRLWQKQLKELTEQQVNYLEQIELPTSRVLLEMEERGVQIDTNHIRSLDARFAEGISGVVASIRRVAAAEVNLNSPKQVAKLLLEKAGLSLKSTAAEELKKFTGVPLVKNILRYRELSKLRGTYTNVLNEKANNQETYRLHARFNQTATDTGRLSSSEPNLQNIPTRTEEGNEIRKGFIAKAGHVLIDADYSQIEPRLMAHFSQDRALMAIFLDGKDLYDSVAGHVGCDRKTAKILWLAMAYNAGAYKISQTAGITHSQAEVFLTRMKLAFPDFFYWRNKVIAQAQIDGGITTMFGAFRKLDYDFAHLGPNYTVQGSAAEIMKLALIMTRDMDPTLTCHDELLLEVVEGQKDSTSACLKDIMESVVTLSVPLVVEVGIGSNWSEAKGK